MRKLIALVIIALTLSNCQSEEQKTKPKTIGDFTFSSQDIVANLPFTITYNGKSDLSNSFFHQVKHSKAYPYDVDFTDNKAVVTIPDSISVVAFHFYKDQQPENNKGKGYVFKVVNEDGKSAVDAEAAHQFYLMNDGAFYDLTTGDATLALNAIETALDENPQLETEWMSSHIYVAQQAGGEKAKAVTEKYIAQVTSKSELDLEDYEQLSTVYSRVQDSKRYDSIKEIVNQKFPESKMALQNMVSSFFNLQSLEEKEQFFADNKKAAMQSPNADYILQNLAVGNFNIKKDSAFNHYFDLMKNATSKASLLNSIAWARAEKGKDLDKAAEMSKLSLNLIEKEQSELNEQPEYYSPNQYKRNLDYSYNMYADTYALLLFKLGKTKEAIAYQAKAIGEGMSPDNNERYIEYLIADGQYDKAVDKAKTFISEGYATPTLNDYFKDAFTEANKEGDANTVLSELKESAKIKQLEKLKKTMLDEKAPDFVAKNLNNEEVKLSALKGKTVILDFWATWCGPCISSFPGMQKAVTKYKDDENVVFLFVDTFESGENRITEVQDFINENKYDFEVLIDPKEENGSSHEIAKKYNISGIPTKVIIGPSGRIKFKDVGYSGSNDKLLNKIDGMIQILKSAP
jgi:thiol-disulfide isomerase/thioredoxin